MKRISLPFIPLAWLCGAAAAQPVELIPPPAPTNTVRHWPAPQPRPAVTNIVLSWNAYTNACFEVLGSRDLTNWYHVAYSPIWTTNIAVPATNAAEFFKVNTLYFDATP